MQQTQACTRIRLFGKDLLEPEINKKDRLALIIITYTLIGLACRSLKEGDSPKLTQ